ncbi:uncharacterized protein LOC114536318 [Dendronephthya gigantea]|uniref:uncharacterized protein LOC114536318 n=1 Tax=Dendronephthya gigantea TaxID=151771 RepID=UPI00106D8F19|nr:uncharacterized protein LOC114536318 [Dendronephthya gigantea]
MRITGQLLRRRSSKPLNEVRHLDLSSTNIVTLNQLELCPKLTTLIASHNLLESVNNLDSCPELWKLDLSHNKLRDINGLGRFSVLGCLILSNNCLDWCDLEDIQQTHILNLSLHGNPKLEKDPYYRMHVIDSFPLVWMLDGILITSAERQQVQKFFAESELKEHPVRHKISKKKCFTPTPLQNLLVNGPFGEKTQHWIKRFPLQEKLTQELDKRRLCYLAYNFQEEFRLQLQRSKSTESETDEELFMAVFDQREREKEKSNMLLLLLVATFEFDISEHVLQQTLDIAKLSKIGCYDTKNIFLLPKKEQASMASLLLSGVKIDRDAKIDDGLYDCLYLCLCDLVSAWHKLTNNHMVSRPSGIRDILAAEIVQLFCIVPAFLLLVQKETGLLELVSSATKESDIEEQLYSVVMKAKAKGTKPDEMLQGISSYILKKVYSKYNCQFGKAAGNILPKEPNPFLRTSSYSKRISTGDESQQYRTSFCLTRTQNIPKNRHGSTVRKIGKALSPRVKSLERLPALGDQFFTSDHQVCGHIVAMPEKNVVLVKLDAAIPVCNSARDLQRSSTRMKRSDNGNRFIYVNTEMLEWNCRGYWKVQQITKDHYSTRQPRQLSKNESNSLHESYLANTVKKQLPVEVWMSFSTLENSPGKSENIMSDGNAVSQNVRDLVKDCLEHAKITNEGSIHENPCLQDEITMEYKKSLENGTKQQKEGKDFQRNGNTSAPEEMKEHADEVESVTENEDDSKLEFTTDDNMISRTENERLEAWKFFRNVKGGLSPDKVTKLWASPGVPCPTPRVEPERNKHNNHTKSRKHLSFPLPGWMEDFQYKNRQASRAVESVCYARKSERERRWTPIISNTANFTSGYPSQSFKSFNANGELDFSRERRPRRHHSDNVQASLKSNGYEQR